MKQFIDNDPTPTEGLRHRCAVVVVAAGSGARFGGLKQLASLGGRPLLGWALDAFDEVEFAQRILVTSPHVESHAAFHSLHSSWPIVRGGETRAMSVRNGLAAIDPSIEFVAVHDGARPFVPILALVAALKRLVADHDLAATIVSAPVYDTLKRIDPVTGAITGTMDRSITVRAETPQVCRRAALLDALDSPGGPSATDEGQALERIGLRTAAVIHNEWNPKITQPADLLAAQAWLAAGNRPHRPLDSILV